MIIRPVWRLRDIPELEHVPISDRRRIIRRATSVWTIIIMWGLCGIIAVVPAAFVGQFIVGRLSPVWGMVAWAFCEIIFAGIVFQVMMILVRVKVRLAVLDSSSGQRLGACLNCGYDLSGNNGRHCPECGSSVVIPESRDNGISR